jgi:hypothetical protein
MLGELKRGLRHEKGTMISRSIDILQDCLLREYANNDYPKQLDYNTLAFGEKD